MTNPLQQAPQPLIDRDARLVVLWSAKSACSTVYVWFASVCGFVDSLKSYNSVHRHRVRVYGRSPQRRRSVGAFDESFAVVKVIRDPYQRAASIYRHMVRTGTGKKDLLPPENFSFDWLLDALAERGELRSCTNLHFWPQVHPFERERTPDTIINVSKQNLFDELNAVAANRGLPHTDFGWVREYDHRRGAGGNKDYGALLTPSTRAKIEAIYRADFEAYAAYL